MSPRFGPAFNDEVPMQISGERRSKKRYALDLALTYRVLRKGLVKATGCGRTSNISSSGVAFTTDETFAFGTFMELSISWPVLLDKTCLLKWVVEGRVVRSDRQVTAIRLSRHEFRTHRRFDVRPELI